MNDSLPKLLNLKIVNIETEVDSYFRWKVLIECRIKVSESIVKHYFSAVMDNSDYYYIDKSDPYGWVLTNSNFYHKKYPSNRLIELNKEIKVKTLELLKKELSERVNAHEYSTSTPIVEKFEFKDIQSSRPSVQMIFKLNDFSDTFMMKIKFDHIRCIWNYSYLCVWCDTENEWIEYRQVPSFHFLDSIFDQLSHHASIHYPKFRIRAALKKTTKRFHYIYYKQIDLDSQS